ncbi:helix-turn-helix domain-containing protein [Flavobacterium sp.]|uniref:helix-turn-helix domain-containing protein n=1 Tax=Flavobacterium sp. TaxID=239 RepID=UPI0040484E53
MKNQNSSPTLWTKQDTARYLRSSIKTVDRLLRDGRINGFKIGRKVLIYPDSVTEENINLIRPKFI